MVLHNSSEHALTPPRTGDNRLYATVVVYHVSRRFTTEFKVIFVIFLENLPPKR